MRKILSIATLAVLTLASCTNAEFKAEDNIVYFDIAASGVKSAQISTTAGKVETSMLVRIADKLATDVTIEVGFDNAMVDEFNKVNGTDYVALPEDIYPENPKLVIPAGEVGATLNLSISNVPSDGATYALPVKIVGCSSAEVPVSKVQGKFLYILTSPLFTNVPTMKPTKSNDKITALPEGDWGVTVENWTLEFWVKMDGYYINNQALFDSGNNSKGCELYVRFGDANYPYNYLQAKIAGNNDISTARDWDANRWYHVAIVCSKDDKMVRIYRDCVVVAEGGVTYPGDGLFKIDHLAMISSGTSYFRNYCSMGQVKFWKVARTVQELKDNMYFSANPKNPNLIAYWPMNEGQGSNFADVTGNGHDASGPASIVSQWLNNVDFKN